MRERTIKLLCELRLRIGPPLLNKLSDLNPHLLTSITAEFDKVADAAVPMPPAPTRRVRRATSGGACAGAAAAPSGGGGSRGVERMDVSALVGPSLSELADKNWQVRNKALKEIGEILKRAGDVEPNVPDLVAALKGSLSDTNKNLVIVALDVVSTLTQAIGPQVERYAKTIMPPILLLVGDNKRAVQEKSLATLSVWADNIGAEKLWPLVAPTLDCDKISPDSRKLLFDWAAALLERTSTPTADLSALVRPVISGLQYRIAEVRAKAEEMLKHTVRACGLEPHKRLMRDKPAAVQKQLQLILAKYEGGAAAAEAPADSAAPGDALRPSLRRRNPPAAEQPPSRSTSAEREAEVTKSVDVSPEDKENVRVDEKNVRATLLSKTVPKKASTAQPVAAAEVEELLRPSSSSAREARSRKDAKVRWTFEEPQKAIGLAEVLSEQMAPPLTSEAFHAALFSTDFKRHMEAVQTLTTIAEPNEEGRATDALLTNVDLVLKWSTLRILEGNTSVMVKLLPMLQLVFAQLASEAYALSDAEVALFLPTLCDKVGSNNQTLRTLLQRLFSDLARVCPPCKLFGFVVDGADSTKNAKSREECVAQAQRMLETESLESLCSEKQLSRMLPLFARLLANDQPAQIRTAAQASITIVYNTIGERTIKLLGSAASETPVESLLERLRRAAAPSTSLSASLPAPASTGSAGAGATLAASQRSPPSGPSKVSASAAEPHPPASTAQLRLKREAPTTPAKAAATTPAKGAEA